MRNYKFEDAKNIALYITVESHYVKITDAKQVHWYSKQSNKIDDSICIEVGNGDEILAVITSGVDEAEQFALDILNLCQKIKH